MQVPWQGSLVLEISKGLIYVTCVHLQGPYTGLGGVLGTWGCNTERQLWFLPPRTGKVSGERWAGKESRKPAMTSAVSVRQLHGWGAVLAQLCAGSPLLPFRYKYQCSAESQWPAELLPLTGLCRGG